MGEEKPLVDPEHFAERSGVRSDSRYSPRRPRICGPCTRSSLRRAVLFVEPKPELRQIEHASPAQRMPRQIVS
ncbi:MAG: hypothetical protein ACLUHG_00055 [Sutterella wadsworthensis]